jgi:glycosyltransferase involved in cell wall biosynthesis
MACPLYSGSSTLTRQDPAPVLFIQGITEIGGAERELLMIVDRLPSLGFQPVVLCPGIGPLTEELGRRNVEVRCAPLLPWRKLLAYPRRGAAVRALRRVIEMERPSVLHVNDIWWVPQAVRAARGLDIPVVAHVRQEIEPSKARRYELEKVDLVFPVSQRIQQSLEAGGVSHARLQTLYSGLDMSQIPDHLNGEETRERVGIPKKALVLGTVANLFARKGYETMLRALPVLLASFPDIHYLIVGTGDATYEGRLRALAKEQGMTKHVHFAGFQSSVFPYLAVMDVYVHPALMEGFGIAVLEAMSMGKPVVATTTGGLPEIVQDGETGLLVPPGDPDALAKTLSILLHDPARRKMLGDAGRARVETHFTVEAMMNRLALGYESLLGRTSSTLQEVLP